MKKIIFILILILNCPPFIFNCYGQWIKVLDVVNGSVSSFADNGNGRLYAAVPANGIYSTTNYGLNWTFSNSGLLNLQINSIAAKDSICFAATQNGIYCSTNYGQLWTRQNMGADSPIVKAVIIVDNFIFIGCAAWIFKSTNNGNNWQLCNNGLPQNTQTLSLSHSNNRIYAGLSGFSDYGVYLSTNFGDNWININNNMPYRYSYSLYSFQGLVLTGTSDGVYISTNYGNYWRLINEINGNIGLFGLTSSGIQNIFIGAWNYGVFASTNTGLNWASRNEGLSSLNVTALYTLNNYVFLGVNPYSGYREIYRRPVTELVPVIEKNNEIPEDFILFQNYPNPFNPVTLIKYSTKKKSFVNISVYDISGFKIKDLINKEQIPNTYEINLSLVNNSSGIYFYVLKINNNFIDSKKMIYLK